MVRQFVERVESLKFGSVWSGDHVAIPRRGPSPYPYETGMTPASGDKRDASPPSMERSAMERSAMERSAIPDPLGILHFVAACTTRLKLGVSVLVLPMRNPFVGLVDITRAPWR
jgi:alkanesulfonate monooxygenase SsuD/methylene tetrahydromethanopterin reductase-like flavin-dependent oxidoreductase (luciferase family)